MSRRKWISIALAIMMVLMAYLSAYSAIGARHVSAWHSAVFLNKSGRICAAIAVVLAIGLAWLSAEAKKLMATVGVISGVLAGFLCLGTFLFEMLAYSAINGWPEKVVGNFLLIFALLMVIIWLVGGLIRRQIKQKEI